MTSAPRGSTSVLPPEAVAAVATVEQLRGLLVRAVRREGTVRPLDLTECLLHLMRHHDAHVAHLRAADDELAVVA